MQTLERAPSDVGTSKPPKMLHLLDFDRGFPWALCGHICERIVKKNLSPTEEVDCVVCEELWRGRFGL